MTAENFKYSLYKCFRAPVACSSGSIMKGWYEMNVSFHSCPLLRFSFLLVGQRRSELNRIMVAVGILESQTWANDWDMHYPALKNTSVAACGCLLWCAHNVVKQWFNMLHSPEVTETFFRIWKVYEGVAGWEAMKCLAKRFVFMLHKPVLISSSSFSSHNVLSFSACLWFCFDALKIHYEKKGIERFVALSLK